MSFFPHGNFQVQSMWNCQYSAAPIISMGEPSHVRDTSGNFVGFPSFRHRQTETETHRYESYTSYLQRMSTAEQEKPLEQVPSKVEQDEFVKKLEEDDEFEDFPEDVWETTQSTEGTKETRLWEESWEDQDDLKADFVNKLRYVS